MTLAEMEKRAILAALKAAKGDKLEAAARLGIGKTTLYRKLNEYQGGGSRKSRGRKKK